MVSYHPLAVRGGPIYHDVYGGLEHAGTAGYVKGASGIADVVVFMIYNLDSWKRWSDQTTNPEPPPAATRSAGRSQLIAPMARMALPADEKPGACIGCETQGILPSPSARLTENSRAYDLSKGPVCLRRKAAASPAGGVTAGIWKEGVDHGCAHRYRGPPQYQAVQTRPLRGACRHPGCRRAGPLGPEQPALAFRIVQGRPGSDGNASRRGLPPPETGRPLGSAENTFRIMGGPTTVFVFNPGTPPWEAPSSGGWARWWTPVRGRGDSEHAAACPGWA